MTTHRTLAAVLGCLLFTVPVSAQPPAAAPARWTTAIPLIYPESASDLQRMLVTEILLSDARKRALVTEMEDTRQAFWATYPGPASRLVAPRFAELLFIKDLAILASILTTGRSDAAIVITEPVFRSLDGGISARARRDFDVWVELIRGQLGARRREDQVIVNVDRLLPALANARRAYERYHVVRDFAELDAANHELEWVRDARTFTIMIGIRFGELAPAAAEAEYDELVRVFGKAVVDREAGRLFTARRVNGRLVDFRSLRLALSPPPVAGAADDPLVESGLEVIGSDDPLTALRLLVGRDDPERFVKAALRQSRAANWHEVTTLFDQMIAAYGRQPVLDLASIVMRAPRHASGHVALDGLAGRTAPPFDAILWNAARRDPKGFVRATIAVALNTSALEPIASEYARLAALKGEPALLEAARQVVNLALAPRLMMSSAAAAAAPRAVLWGDQAGQLIVEVVTGRVTLAAETAVTIQNPHYASWARFQPGATVTMVKGTSRETWTLVSVTPDAAMVRYSLGGRSGQVYSDAAGFPAVGHRDQLSRPWINDENLPPRGKLTEDQGEGDCGVPRLGRCRWLSRTDSANGVLQTTTVWISDEVPGGLVRKRVETRNSVSLAVDAFEIVAETWSGTPDPAARTFALDALSRAYPRAAAPAGASSAGALPVGATRPPPTAADGGFAAIPAGTAIAVRMVQPIDARTMVGARNLRAELAQPLIIGGQTYADAGAVAYLSFLQDMDATRQQRRPILFVRLDFITIRGVAVAVQGADAATAGVATRGPVIAVPAGTVLTFRTK